MYAELAALQPAGFRYATFVQADGVSFVHIATTENGHEAPLPQLPAFRAFLADIGERCEQPPATTRLDTQVGSYAL